MARRFYKTAIYFFLYFLLDSAASESRNTAVDPFIFQRDRVNGVSKDIPSTDESTSGTKSFNDRPCIDCYKSRNAIQAPQTENISNFSKAAIHSSSSNIITMNKIAPEESENVVSSRKYSPQVGSQHDGFIPVTGPYGMKSKLATANSLKPTIAHSFRVGSSARNIDASEKHTRVKNHSPRNVQSVKAHQSVQRRAQYRHPKAIEDLTVKESITNENILGNGNFEIIRGGIYSDQDANEIIGSRRMGRGFGSFVVPVYQQSRFNHVQNFQFPPVFQTRVQNHFNPVYYPRAPY